MDMIERECAVSKASGCDVSFFFQAEDGIRDADVTGVQTCALPISSNACLARKCPTASSKPRRKGCSSACSEDDHEPVRLLHPAQEAGIPCFRGQGAPADHCCP